MKKYLLTFLLTSFLLTGFTQIQIHSRVEIDISEVSLKTLGSYGIPADAGYIDRKAGTFIAELSQNDLQKLADQDVEYQVLIEDMQDFYVSRNQNVSDRDVREAASQSDVPVPDGFNLGSMGGFLTYDEILAELDSMFQQYPELITEIEPVNDMTSIEGRPIYYLKISDNPNADEDEPEVLYTSLTHAREPGGMMTLIFYMYHLLENYEIDDEIKQLVDNTEMYFVPIVNPDGYIYNQENDPNGGGMWRKNRRNNGNGSYGVDLNRNYGYEWGYDNSGSSGNPWDQTYRGEEPFSEPETQIIKDFCESHEFGFALNYHTYSDLLLYTWGYTEEPCEDDELLYAYAEQMTQVNNYTFGPGSTTIYPSNGGSDDWMYGEQETKNKIFSFTPEVGSSSDGFWPASSQIIPHCQENLLMNILTAKFAGHYAMVEETDPPLIQETDGYFHLDVKRYGLEDGTEYTVSVEPISDNITETGEDLVYEELELMETVADSVMYVLDENIAQGDSIVYQLSMDDGFTVQQDTIVKLFGTPVSIYDNEIENLDEFENNGWGITDEDYTSEPYSIADSPGTDYFNNQYKTIRVADTIDLTEAVFANFSFMAKWEIESGYDYVQVQVSADEGDTWEPLSGQYTSTGTGYQQEGEPVYDGMQSAWVLEEINFQDYLGEQLFIRFVFESDGGVTEDGFYFDDLEVVILEQLSTEATHQNRKADIHVYPNPAKENIFVNIATETGAAEITFYNLKGEKVMQKRVRQGSVSVSVKSWPEGVYMYTVEAKGKKISSGKIIVK